MKYIDSIWLHFCSFVRYDREPILLAVARRVNWKYPCTTDPPPEIHTILNTIHQQHQQRSTEHLVYCTLYTIIHYAPPALGVHHQTSRDPPHYTLWYTLYTTISTQLYTGLYRVILLHPPHWTMWRLYNINFSVYSKVYSYTGYCTMYTMCTLQYKDLYRLPHHPHHYWTTSTSSKFKYIIKEFINWKYPTARPLAQLHFPEKFQSRKLHFTISKATTARDIECTRNRCAIKVQS